MNMQDFTKNQMLTLYNPVRKIDSPQIWAIGCSITVATFINLEQRYYNIVKERLNLPLSIVAQNNSSILWAADQILRRDLRSGDYVLWGLTSRFRFPYFSRNTVLHIHQLTSSNNLNTLEITAEDFVDTDLLYRSLNSIHAVINFCRKLDVKLYICGFLIDETLQFYLKELPEYFDLGIVQNPLIWADLSTDQQHPGPKQHAIYAEHFLKKIKNDTE
jgi:hypothetical protein